MFRIHIIQGNTSVSPCVTESPACETVVYTLCPKLVLGQQMAGYAFFIIQN